MVEETRSDLLIILKNLNKSYQKLLELAYDKEEILVANDVERLVELNEKEEQVVEKIEDYDKKREEKLTQLGRELEINSGNVKFSFILEGMEEDFKIQFKELRKELLEVMDELSEMNERNAVLLKEALHYNDFLYGLFDKLQKKGIIYQKNGISTENKKKNVLNGHI